MPSRQCYPAAKFGLQLSGSANDLIVGNLTERRVPNVVGIGKGEAFVVLCDVKHLVLRVGLVLAQRLAVKALRASMVAVQAASAAWRSASDALRCRQS